MTDEPEISEEVLREIIESAGREVERELRQPAQAETAPKGRNVCQMKKQ